MIGTEQVLSSLGNERMGDPAAWLSGAKGFLSISQVQSFSHPGFLSSADLP